MMKACDTLFMVGTGFPYSEWLPKKGSVRGVQIDISPRILSSRYPNEVNLCRDALLFTFGNAPFWGSSPA